MFLNAYFFRFRSNWSWPRIGLLSSMTLFSFVYVGDDYATGVYLPTFSVLSKLQLSQRVKVIKLNLIKLIYSTTKQTYVSFFGYTL